jgi:lysophospholipase L1-like esterase
MQRWAHALLVVGSLLITSLLLDRALGWLGYASELRPHVAHNPGVSETRRNLEFEYIFETNAWGLRYRELPAQKPAGSRRIFVAGDSYTEGFGVAADRTFAALLEQRYRTGDTPVAFVNGGLAGAGPDDYGRLLLEVGLTLDPDGVLICFFANDLTNTPLRVRPEDLAYSPPERRGLDRALHGGWPHLHTLVARLERQRADSRRVVTRDFVALISAEARRQGVPEERIAAWQEDVPDDLVAAVNRGAFAGPALSYGLLNPAYWLDSIDVASPRAEAKWRGAAQLLAFLFTRIRSSGRSVGLVFIPSRLQYDPASQRASNPRVRLGMLMRSAWLTDTSELAIRLGRLAERENVPFLDLTPALRKAVGDGTTLNWPLDGHFNPDGHRVAAEAIAAWIDEARVFPFLAAAPAGP